MRVNSLGLWYCSKAKLYLREAEEYFRQFRFSESIQSFQECIEFAAKAICELLGKDYGKKHDISQELEELAKTADAYRKELSRLALVSSRWVGMKQRARMLMEYGNQDAKVPATDFVTRRDVELIRADANEACNLLNRIELREKFKYPIKIGILNGYVEKDDSSEKPCNYYSYTEFKSIDIWAEFFAQITANGNRKYDVEEISISEISNEFAVIINPFGEVYPEKDFKRKLCFNIIKNYIGDGGIFVNVAGFPFFYGWDVVNGKSVALIEEKLMVPETIRVELDKLGGKVKRAIIEQFKTVLLFSGSLFWREFDAVTTSDTPVHSGPFLLDIYQKDEDRQKVGDLVNIGKDSKIWEFRAVTERTKNLIPLLRARRPEFGEVYPIAAIKYGWGYLIVGGMHLKSENEFERLAAAVDRFCEWVARSTQ